jgi:hypothetical protein
VAPNDDEPPENVPAVDTQRYPVEDITMQTPCELHVKAKNITALAAYRSALPVIPGGTIHGRQVSPGYSVLTVEQIVEAGRQNEKLELDFVGGDGEQTLGEAPTVAFNGARPTSNLLEIQRL